MKPEIMQQYIYRVKDFPKNGIVFWDIMPLLANADAFSSSINSIVSFAQGKKIDKVLSPESRGFIFGSAVAKQLQSGFVCLRKEGKLPRDAYHEQYSLEYGSHRLYLHKDAINPHEEVIIVDDVLATGGTAHAAAMLAQKCGAKVVGMYFLINLTYITKSFDLAAFSPESVLLFSEKITENE